MLTPIPTPQPRILFVEDDIGKRYVIARQLRHAGFVVDEAETGRQGLDKVSPDHDVAILDIKLPDMLGFDVCKRIKQDPRTAQVKILELSATLATAEDRAHGLENGADTYLVHPVELVELLAAVRALVRMRNLEREKQRAMDLFLAALGHDLRNPMTVVSAALDLLTASADLGAGDRSAVAKSRRAMDRMSRMVDQLLVFTRTVTGAEPMVRQQVDLAALARVATADLAGAHAIALDAPAPVFCIGDLDRLRRVLDNLISNAIKHGAGPVQVSVTALRDRAQLVVHNGGPAIPPDAIATLFDPFVRSGKRDGFGLGLFIVDQIVRAHGGTIELTSSPVEGTTFRIAIPA